MKEITHEHELYTAAHERDGYEAVRVYMVGLGVRVDWNVHKVDLVKGEVRGL